jgi:hypothetical protein
LTLPRVCATNRCVRPRLRAGAALVALLGVALLAAPASGAGAAPAAIAAPGSPGPARVPAHVLIVSMAGVTWEDVAAGHAPVLAALARHWSMGALSIRTVHSPTNPASAFATIGAGNRAIGLGAGVSALEVPNAGPLPGGGLLVADFAQVVKSNARLHFGAVPGALGTALHAHDLRTGVVGNQDEYVGGNRTPMRFGALALADSSGIVDTGDVGQHLTPGPALTAMEDPAAIATATASALATANVVLVELSETRRVGDALGPARAGSPAGIGPRPGPGAAAGADTGDLIRAAAVSLDDATLGRLLSEVDLSRDTVWVLGTSGPGGGSPDRLMVAVAAGVGALPGGWLTSPTTRRHGMVTLPDVAPTILRRYGIQAPASMTGQVIRSVPAGGGRLSRLVAEDRAALDYGRRLAGFLLAVVLAGIAVFFLGWWQLRRGRPAWTALELGALAVVATPLACLMQAGIGAERWAAVPSFAFLAAADALVVALGFAGPWRRQPIGPAAVVAGLSAAGILVDLVTGAHDQLSSLMGYSPIVAGRFYGLSPLSFAALATYVLVLTGVLAARQRHPGLVVAAIGAGTVAIAGAPMFGAKFGAILSLVPAFGLLALLVSGRRISFAKTALLGVAAAAAALGIGLLDALRPIRSQTHIGRFVSALAHGGPGSVSDVLVRKADANLGIYAKAPIAVLVPLCLGFAAIAVGRPPAWLAARMGCLPGLRSGILAALAAGAIAIVVNDSGAAIPGIGLALGTPLVIAILLRVPAAGGATSALDGQNRSD